MPKRASPAKSTKAPCRECHAFTNHSVVGEFQTDDIEEDDEGHPMFSWIVTYELLRCLGCDSGSLRISATHPDTPQVERTYYPAPIARRLPSWRYELPKDLWELMHEVYAALNAGHHRIALMGARTLVDMTIVQAVGDVGTFKAKLEQLRLQDHITKQHEKILFSALDAGSAAAHRGFKPTKENIGFVLDIVEHLLQSRFVLQNKSELLEQSTPKRSKPSTGNTQ